jgi:hypothetical protein
MNVKNLAYQLNHKCHEIKDTTELWKQMFPIKLKFLIATGIRRTSVQNLQTHNMDLQMNFIKLFSVCGLGRIG